MLCLIDWLTRPLGACMNCLLFRPVESNQNIELCRLLNSVYRLGYTKQVPHLTQYVLNSAIHTSMIIEEKFEVRFVKAFLS